MLYFSSPVLADSAQLIGVLLILAAAVGYLTIYYHRKFKGGAGGGCGCDCGIPLKHSRDKDAASAAKQFLPAENLADLAARHREERESQCCTETQSGSCCCSHKPDEHGDKPSQSPPNP